MGVEMGVEYDYGWDGKLIKNLEARKVVTDWFQMNSYNNRVNSIHSTLNSHALRCQNKYGLFAQRLIQNNASKRRVKRLLESAGISKEKIDIYLEKD